MPNHISYSNLGIADLTPNEGFINSLSSLTDIQNMLMRGGIQQHAQAQASYNHAVNINPSYTVVDDEYLECDMRESRAAPPSEFSWVISYNEDRQVYILQRPRHYEGEVGIWSDDFANTINEAYDKASSYAANMSSLSPRNNRYSLWPRRNSLYYRALVNKQDYSNILLETSQIEVETIDFKGFHTNITTAILEKSWIRLDREIKLLEDYFARNTKSTYKVVNFIQNYIKDTTKIEWVYGIAKVGSSRNYLMHPDSVIRVYNTVDKLGGYRYINRELASSLTQVCNCCKDYFNSGMLVSMKQSSKINTGFYCYSCLDEKEYFKCSNGCKEWHHDDAGCPVYLNAPPQTIYSYSKDVRSLIHKMPTMLGDKKVNGDYLRYGLELEVFAKNNVHKEIATHNCGKALLNKAILKADASLINHENGTCGFEIVTIPATLEYHRKELWKDFFNTQYVDQLTAAQCVKSWNTKCCGIHVHITRAALSEMQLSKMLVFYHEPANSEFLSRIAGRTVSKDAIYCKTAKKHLGSYTKSTCENHHDAITISRRNRGKTAEVRIFRGNATYHGIMRCLEFVDATVQWCGQNSPKDILDYKSFLDWFNAPIVKSQYPELKKYLIQLGYLKHRIKNEKFKHLEIVPTDLQTA